MLRRSLLIAFVGLLLLPSTMLGHIAQAQAQQYSQTSSSTHGSSNARSKAGNHSKPNTPQACANPSQAATGTNTHHYVNGDRKNVQSPTTSMTAPTGATAQCRDGSYSFSQHRQGTCSHHGGVGKWLKN